jgi:hypothetical protein
MIIIRDIHCFAAQRKLLYRVHSIKMGDDTSQVLYQTTRGRNRASGDLEVFQSAYLSPRTVHIFTNICFDPLRKTHFRRVRKSANKTKKTTISFVISVCPSVCPHVTTRLPTDGFPLNLIHEYFAEIYREDSSFNKI